MRKWLPSVLVLLALGCTPTTPNPSAWDWAEAEVAKDSVAWNGPLPLTEGGGGPAAAPLPSVGSPSSPGVPWCGYREAVEESRASGRPLWVHFELDRNCPSCVVQHRDVFPDPAVAAVASKFVPVRLPLDHPWARSMGVAAAPCDVFFPPGRTTNGRLVTVPGLKTPAAYAAHLEKYLDFFTEQKDET